MTENTIFNTSFTTEPDHSGLIPSNTNSITNAGSPTNNNPGSVFLVKLSRASSNLAGVFFKATAAVNKGFTNAVIQFSREQDSFGTHNSTSASTKPMIASTVFVSIVLPNQVRLSK